MEGAMPPIDVVPEMKVIGQGDGKVSCSRLGFLVAPNTKCNKGLSLVHQDL